ncbi:MAG TPA: NAD(P)/FAD-dependent oxidoreductase [Lacipirellulaceae bacterium]
MVPSAREYDCIVIGGGPSGSTVAALVAEAGYRTLLLERDAEPRRKVGESLMPDSYWVFERLGVLDDLRNSPFVRKVGVQFVSSSQRESSPFLFTRHDTRECGRTWHVEREQFDQLLLDNAAKKGAEIHRGVRVREVVFENGRAVGVRLMHDPSAAADDVIRAKVVVDAAGQQGLISGRAAARKLSEDMKKAAIWGHFRGARREIIDDGVMTLVLRTRSNQCWFWHIPLSNDVVSVGVVGDAEYLFKGRGTPDEIFAEEVADCPSVAQRLAGAEKVTGLDVVKEYSYKTERAAGDGWLFVGDAWGFIDPLYSSGVLFALKSGQLAADCIIEGLKTGDTTAAQLGKWVPEFDIATNWVRKLVLAFYTGQFRVGRFIREYPQHQKNMTDILIGRIFYPGVGRIFDDLEPWLERMKAEGASA